LDSAAGLSECAEELVVECKLCTCDSGQATYIDSDSVTHIRTQGTPTDISETPVYHHHDQRGSIRFLTNAAEEGA
jgi:hypothetical protein